MAWKTYTPALPTKPTTPVSLSIPDANTRSTPTLRIDEATMKALGWKDGTPLELQVGEAEHAGKIRIEKVAASQTLLRAASKESKAKRARIVLGRMPGLGDDAFKGAVQFEISRGGGRHMRVDPDAAGRRAIASAAARHGGGGAARAGQVSVSHG